VVLNTIEPTNQPKTTSGTTLKINKSGKDLIKH
jgi:hypothetical protein